MTGFQAAQWDPVKKISFNALVNRLLASVKKQTTKNWHVQEPGLASQLTPRLLASGKEKGEETILGIRQINRCYARGW